MKTAEVLLNKYGDKFVPLVIVAADYYGLTDLRTINRTAARRGFVGLRPFRAYDSAKAPLLVDVENLAEALDNRARG